MKFYYYEETDSLYIDLSEKKSVDSHEISPGIILDFDENKNLVGIDIDHASKVANLTNLETKNLPLKNMTLSS